MAMSEQGPDIEAFPAAWTLGTGAGHPILFRRVGSHFHGSLASGDPRVGTAAGGCGDRGTGVGRRSHLSSRRGSTPEWYRRVAVSASAGSLILLIVLVAVVR